MFVRQTRKKIFITFAKRFKKKFEWKYTYMSKSKKIRTKILQFYDRDRNNKIICGSARISRSECAVSGAARRGKRVAGNASRCAVHSGAWDIHVEIGAAAISWGFPMRATTICRGGSLQGGVLSSCAGVRRIDNLFTISSARTLAHDRRIRGVPETVRTEKITFYEEN